MSRDRGAKLADSCSAHCSASCSSRWVWSRSARRMWIESCPGSRSGGVNIGGMSRADARVALGAALGQLEDGAVTVRSGTGYAVIAYTVVGREVDFDGMLDRAAAVGRGGTRFDEALEGVRQLTRPVVMPTLLSFEPDRLAAELAAFAERGYRQPRDAGVSSTQGGADDVDGRGRRRGRRERGSLRRSRRPSWIRPPRPRSTTRPRASRCLRPSATRMPGAPTRSPSGSPRSSSSPTASRNGRSGRRASECRGFRR